MAHLDRMTYSGGYLEPEMDRMEYSGGMRGVRTALAQRNTQPTRATGQRLSTSPYSTYGSSSAVAAPVQVPLRASDRVHLREREAREAAKKEQEEMEAKQKQKGEKLFKSILKRRDKQETIKEEERAAQAEKDAILQALNAEKAARKAIQRKGAEDRGDPKVLKKELIMKLRMAAMHLPTEKGVVKTRTYYDPEQLHVVERTYEKPYWEHADLAPEYVIPPRGYANRQEIEQIKAEIDAERLALLKSRNGYVPKKELSEDEKKAQKAAKRAHQRFIDRGILEPLSKHHNEYDEVTFGPGKVRADDTQLFLRALLTPSHGDTISQDEINFRVRQMLTNKDSQKGHQRSRAEYLSLVPTLETKHSKADLERYLRQADVMSYNELTKHGITPSADYKGHLHGHGITIPKADFIKEHEHLLSVLNKGTKAERMQEAASQAEELAGVTGAGQCSSKPKHSPAAHIQHTLRPTKQIITTIKNKFKDIYDDPDYYNQPTQEAGLAYFQNHALDAFQLGRHYNMTDNEIKALIKVAREEMDPQPHYNHSK